MAAAAKLAVAPPGTPTPTTTRTRHRASTTRLLAVSSSATAPTSTTTTVDSRLSTPLACMWQEVQGAGDWRGLVEPLHPLLRAEMVRYAELVTACYRAVDLDPRSKRYLNCKHGKKQMLQAVGMHGAGYGYAVTKYIYAAPDDMLAGNKRRRRRRRRRKSRPPWIGYVAVASDREAARLGRRDILVSFRGTVTGSEWLANFMSTLAPARFDPGDPRPDVRVESGFLSLYTSGDDDGKFTVGSCRNQLLSEISSLVAKHKDEEMSITLAGHSMGSSLALLLGYDLAELGLNNNNGGGSTSTSIPITVYSFAGPRVGNLEFKNRCDELGVKVLRVVNVKDPVTKMPGFLFNEGACRVLAGRYELPWSKACYAHVGVQVALDFFEAGDIACVHDLQAHIDQILRLKCTDDDDGVTTDSIMDEEAAAQGGYVVRDQRGRLQGRPIHAMLESWRWQMAAIHAADLMQALGIV